MIHSPQLNINFLLVKLTIITYFILSSANSCPAWTSGFKPGVPAKASFSRVYHLPLKVHLGASNRPPGEFLLIFEEINHIWHSQAGICFDIQTASGEQILASGIDLWFVPNLGFYNGTFTDDHDIHVIDTPDLAEAPHPASHPAARTAAHELGHSLGLSHNQNSDDNLMRSKTLGWHLNKAEVSIARKSARDKSNGNDESKCLPTKIKN